MIRSDIGMLVLALLIVPLSLGAEDVQPAVDLRYAKEGIEEKPSFQRHVVPLLGRLGCNSRACHGSFQGQGGFRLSLFGYDFEADHAAISEADQGRIDLQQPSSSLILAKPTLAVEHEGGKHFVKGSWEYRLLHRWIAAGAAQAKPNETTLASLEVEPHELVFDRPRQRRPLKIVARWSDGTREDVTPLCRFQTNDESVATISETGVVSAVGQGDTHIVVFYDNGITPVPVIVPIPQRSGPQYSDVATPTKIDELVVQKLRKVGIIPSPRCTDAEFLRRVSLDLTGTPPTPAEVMSFLEDTSPQKRSRKINELLESPAYSHSWATWLCDLLGNTESNLPVGGEQGLRREKSAQWYGWIRRRIEENTPYDKMVEGMVLATSRRADQNVDDYFAEMSAYFREENPSDFSSRATMPYFWTRGRFTPPQPLRFSYAFLGVRMECAQCHKHPYDQWTKEDYEQFQLFFEGVNFSYSHRGRSKELKEALGLTADQDSGGYKRLFAKLARSGTVVPWGEVRVPTLERSVAQSKRKAKRAGTPTTGRVFTPKLLGGEQVLATEYDDARQPLMEWLKQSENPYFARALVNRVWAAYFGIGVVDPPDDMNLANPPSNEPLLRYLADGFVEHDYDLKWLHRTILGSRTYQLSWRPNETNRSDTRNFSRALPRRLPAEVVYDALVHATAKDQAMQAMHDDAATIRDRAIGVSTGFSRSDFKYAVNLFGKPSRKGICDCDRSNEPSLLQTIYLRNDQEMNALLDRKDGWLAEIDTAAVADRPEEFIQHAYLRTFARLPTDSELAVARSYLQKAETPHAGLRDLMWALLNSKEFILNH